MGKRTIRRLKTKLSSFPRRHHLGYDSYGYLTRFRY